MNEEEKLLVEKIAFLRYELAKCADAGQKFSIKKELEETGKRLNEILDEKFKASSKLNQEPINMSEQTEPNTTEKQEEKISWYKNKPLMTGIVTIVSGILISVISIIIGNDKNNEKTPILTTTPTYSSYIVEGVVRNQDNKPVLNKQIMANNKSKYTDSQNGTFSIQGVEIGKNGKIEFYIEGETLLKDSSEYDVKANKVKILQALRINLTKSEEDPKPTNTNQTTLSKPKINYHSITLQGDYKTVDYVLFDDKKILPKNGIVKLPNLGTDFKNVKIYFKDTSKQNYDKDINNQVTEIGIN